MQFLCSVLLSSSLQFSWKVCTKHTMLKPARSKSKGLEQGAPISLQGYVNSYLFLLFLLPFLFEVRIVAPHRTPWLRPIASGTWCALEVRLRWSTVALLMSSHQMTGGWSTKQTRVKFACNRWGLFQTTNFIQSLSDLSCLLACFCSRSYPNCSPLQKGGRTILWSGLVDP